MRFLVAPDSYKGTLSAARAAEIVECALLARFPDAVVGSVPLGDGGDGTMAALGAAMHARWMCTEVTDPLGGRTLAAFALLRDDKVLAEMAQASGIMLVPPKYRNPFHTTSFGTGELLGAAQYYSNDLIMGIGGSATVDGGVGMARALGASFWDASGREIVGGPREFRKIVDVDFGEHACRWHEGVSLRVMSDVNNPLVGSRGAAAVFGPQKGASPADVEVLERSLAVLGDVLSEIAERDVASLPGAGAAGGMGAMLVAMLGARLLPGSEMALDIVDFDALVTDCDLVITGEGRLDSQSMGGKLPVTVARRARALGVPAAVLPGFVEPGAGETLGEEFDWIVPCFEDRPKEDPDSRTAEKALFAAAQRLSIHLER
ncbi:MAG: glycerate kinase [Bacillota bacterium]